MEGIKTGEEREAIVKVQRGGRIVVPRDIMREENIGEGSYVRVAIRKLDLGDKRGGNKHGE